MPNPSTPSRVQRIVTLTVWFAIVTLLAGCAGVQQDPTRDWSAREIYEEAKSALDRGNYEEAVDYYERLEARYPFGPYAEQAQLEIIYAYHEMGEPESAIAAADRFIRTNPRHPNADYAYYMRGLVAYERGIDFLGRLVGLDPSQRDPNTAEEAFQYFRELLERYPESRYVADARERMERLRERLAQHELHVANYYLRRGAPLAAANRATYVVENFQGTEAVPQALEIMIDAYEHLGRTDLADDARRVLALNHPERAAARESPLPPIREID